MKRLPKKRKVAERTLIGYTSTDIWIPRQRKVTHVRGVDFDEGKLCSPDEPFIGEAITEPVEKTATPTLLVHAFLSSRSSNLWLTGVHKSATCTRVYYRYLISHANFWATMDLRYFQDAPRVDPDQ